MWKTGTDAPWAYLLCCPQFSFTTIEIIRTGWVTVENNFIFTCIFDFWLPSANTAHHLRVSYWILFFSLHSFWIKSYCSCIFSFWVLKQVFHVLTCYVVPNCLLQSLKLSVPAELSLKIILYSPVCSISGHLLLLFTQTCFSVPSAFHLDTMPW